MNNKELKYILRDILRLDSIFQLLHFHERVILWGKILNYDWAVLPERVRKLVAYLEKYPVELPELKVGQDRLTYVQLEGFQQLACEYRELHKDFELTLKNILK